MKFPKPSFRTKDAIIKNLVALALLTSVGLIVWGVASFIVWLIPLTWHESVKGAASWIAWALVFYWLVPNTFITWKK